MTTNHRRDDGESHRWRTEMADNSERKTLTVEEAAKELGLGKNAAYEGVRTEQIPSIRIGRRILVPRVALDRMLNATAA